jgi:aconitate hydratase
MMRGTFANIRIKNEMLDGVEGGYSIYYPKDGSPAEQAPIYDVAMKYEAEGTPLVIIGGKEYGTGSSRDWAAKGTRLLGVRAVIVESFERIHRSNLVGMGVLPCVFPDGVSRTTLGLTGDETFDLVAPGLGNDQPITPRMTATLAITRKDGSQEKVDLRVRLDTLDEVEYFNNGGILQYVLRNLMAA